MLIAPFVVLLSGNAAANTVVKSPALAIDGDTLFLDHDNVRLFGIDALELKQYCSKEYGGNVAREYLKTLIKDSVIECHIRGKDKYDRLIGECFSNGINLNKAMVLSGHAFAYKRYTSKYTEQEKIAQQQKRGVWNYNCLKPEKYRIRNHARN